MDLRTKGESWACISNDLLCEINRQGGRVSVQSCWGMWNPEEGYEAWGLPLSRLWPSKGLRCLPPPSVFLGLHHWPVPSLQSCWWVWDTEVVSTLLLNRSRVMHRKHSLRPYQGTKPKFLVHPKQNNNSEILYTSASQHGLHIPITWGTLKIPDSDFVGLDGGSGHLDF